jgi:hypothetical protein
MSQKNMGILYSDDGLGLAQHFGGFFHQIKSAQAKLKIALNCF